MNVTPVLKVRRVGVGHEKQIFARIVGVIEDSPADISIRTDCACHYCVGAEILVRTDHLALRWLNSFKTPQGQFARWLEELSDYRLKIEHNTLSL